MPGSITTTPPSISQLKVGTSTYEIKDAYARDQIEQIIVAGVQYSVADSLPTAASQYKGWIYLIPDSASGASANVHDEYICIGSGTSWSWEQIGTTDTDLSNYLKKADVSTATGKVTVPSATHSHTVPALNTISYTPGGTVAITSTTAAATLTSTATDITSTGTFTPAGTITVNAGVDGASVEFSGEATYSKTTAATPVAQKSAVTDLGYTPTSADVTGSTYTPSGTITITGDTSFEGSATYDKATSATATNTKTALTDITFTTEAATVTGSSYTPAGSVNITDNGHTHSNTLTSSATGDVQYVYGGATSQVVSAITSSTFASVAYNVSYISGTETLVMDIASMNALNAVTTRNVIGALSTSYLKLTNASAEAGITASFSGTAATIKPAVSYSKFQSASYSKVTAIGLGYTSTDATITGAVTLPTFGFSGTQATITPAVTYSKLTAASYMYTSKVTLTTGSSTAPVTGTITLPSYSFSGTEGNVSVTGTYSKATGVSYTKVTGATFTGSASTLTPAYSTAFSTTATSTAAAGSYGTFDVTGGSVVTIAAT